MAVSERIRQHKLLLATYLSVDCFSVDDVVWWAPEATQYLAYSNSRPFSRTRVRSISTFPCISFRGAKPRKRCLPTLCYQKNARVLNHRNYKITSAPKHACFSLKFPLPIIIAFLPHPISDVCSPPNPHTSSPLQPRASRAPCKRRASS